MQNLAAHKGGKCLSKEYINNQTPLKWKCKEGHIWNVKSNSITSGSWCAKCSHNKHKTPIEEFQRIAESRGGKLLSKKHINGLKKLKFQCAKGHVWMTSVKNKKGKLINLPF